MRTAPYPLKQAQYARIYQASERTVRTWMKKGAPLDDPAEMLASFIFNQRSTPVGAQKLAKRKQVQARYQQELDPAAGAAAIRNALGEWISELDAALGFARDFARKHEPANWRQMVERCHVISGEIERLYELAGISGDDEVPDQPARADLAKPVIWNWIKDREATNQPRA